MQKAIYILFLLLFIQQVSNACETGFACSVYDLENKQTKKLFLIFNNFFNKELNSDIFFKKLNENTSYDDLFIFRNVI